MSTIGSLIDRLYEIKQEKSALNKQVDALDEEYDKLELRVLAMMDEIGLESAKASTALATKSETKVPTAVDWDAVSTYIMENDALYLLQRRLSVTAIKELMDTGEVLPGIELMPITKLSLTKRKS